MNSYVLSDNDLVKVRLFVSEICQEAPTLVNLAKKSSILSRSPILSEISQFVAEQIFIRKAPYFLIKNIPIDDTEPTPKEIISRNDKPSRFNDGMAILLSSLAGQVFSFPEAQYGNMTCDISPTKQSEEMAIGSGSKIKFEWHTDNAYLLHGGDFFTLMCVRNPDFVPTIIAAPNLASLPEEISGLLHEKVFSIRPNRLGIHGEEAVAKQSVLFGHPCAPFIRLNMNYNMCAGVDEKYQRALDALKDIFSKSAQQIILNPGDLIFVDNYRTAHGRPSFTASFTSSDRLLKRTYIETSWRGRIALRQDPDSLIVNSARPG